MARSSGRAIGKVPVSAAGTALLLTASFQDIPAATVSLTPGNWMVVGSVHLTESGAGDVTFDLVGQLVTTGGTAAILPSASLPFFTVVTASQAALQPNIWWVNVTATTTAKLQARKSGGSGASATSVYTHITAFWMGTGTT